MEGIMGAVVQYPIAGVVIVVVVIFLRFLERQRKELQIISNSCHAHQDAVVDRVAKVIDVNSEMIKQNCQAFGEVVESLRRMNGRSK